MTTWIDQPENSGGISNKFFFLIDDTHFFLIDNVYKLIIEDGSDSITWIDQVES